MRSLRKKSGQEATKKYLHADFLQFLLKINEKHETESSIYGEGKNESTESQEEEETETVVQQMDEASVSSRDAATFQHRRRKTTKVSGEIDRKILRSLEKNRTWWGWGILHFSPTVCDTVFCWWQTWFQNGRPKSHQGYKNSLRICQFSIFDANTFSKQFTWHRQIVALSLQWVGFKLRKHFDFTPDNRHSQSNANIPWFRWSSWIPHFSAVII